MTLTPLSMDDTCNALKEVLAKKTEQYDFTADELADVIGCFASGMYAQILYFVNPEDPKDLEQYIINPAEIKMNIPDNLAEMDFDEAPKEGDGLTE